MKLARRKAVWITTLLVLTSLLSWAALRLWNGKKPEQSAWRSRGKVSEILLQLSGEGPKGVEALRVPDGFDVEVAAGPATNTPVVTGPSGRACPHATITRHFRPAP